MRAQKRHPGALLPCTLRYVSLAELGTLPGWVASGGDSEDCRTFVVYYKSKERAKESI
jgi:hypothetical protein